MYLTNEGEGYFVQIRGWSHNDIVRTVWCSACISRMFMVGHMCVIGLVTESVGQCV